MPTNRDVIRMHLVEFILDYPNQSWYTLLSYCLGYYEVITEDILWAVHDLQKYGYID